MFLQNVLTIPRGKSDLQSANPMFFLLFLGFFWRLEVLCFGQWYFLQLSTAERTISASSLPRSHGCTAHTSHSYWHTYSCSSGTAGHKGTCGWGSNIYHQSVQPTSTPFTSPLNHVPTFVVELHSCSFNTATFVIRLVVTTHSTFLPLLIFYCQRTRVVLGVTNMRMMNSVDLTLC